MKQRFVKDSRRIFKGFSLIELLVVIGIIAALLSILAPAVMKCRAVAKRTDCAFNLKQIDLAIRLYQNNYNNIYPCATDPVKPGIWLWMGRGWRPFVDKYLFADNRDRNALILLCPSDSTDPNKYESTSYGYSMSFYHSPEQINNMSSTAEQWDISLVRPSAPQKSPNVTRPAGKIIIGEWYSNHSRIKDDGGWWCNDGRRNFLFVDGHIDYIKAEKIRKANDGFANPNLTKDGISGQDYP